MPTRNIVKLYAPDSYYHVYSRGVNKADIFHDDEDKDFFLSLFKRYLSHEQLKRPKHRAYKNYSQQISLLAYCLMDNHIHLLLYQHHEPTAIATIMRSIMTSYSVYFNKKYRRVGPLFQSAYLASKIDRDSYLDHISRYIHLNPAQWRRYPYSSLRYYQRKAVADWIKPEMILGMFRSRGQDYTVFLEAGFDDTEIIDTLAHE